MNGLKINKTKLIARVMVLILLFTSVFNLSGCYFGPTITYDWEVYTHNEFVEEIEKFNSINDELCQSCCEGVILWS